MISRRSRLRLLPPDALLATSEVDHADWNYGRLLGWLQRKRFRLLLSLMGDERFGRLLEVGYGSGVFMPELRARCGELFGIDPHPRNREVGDVLSRHGVQATLLSGSATELPFADGFFDGVVAVSALEFIDDIQATCLELSRVLTPSGALFVVTPGHSPLLDLALRITTGEDAAEDYGDRRQMLMPALLRRFRIDEASDFPPLLGRLAPVYRALRLVKDSGRPDLTPPAPGR